MFTLPWGDDPIWHSHIFQMGWLQPPTTKQIHMESTIHLWSPGSRRSPPVAGRRWSTASGVFFWGKHIEETSQKKKIAPKNRLENASPWVFFQKNDASLFFTWWSHFQRHGRWNMYSICRCRRSFLMKNGCGRRFRKRVKVQQKIAHSQSTHPSGENLRNSHVKHQAFFGR